MFRVKVFYTAFGSPSYTIESSNLGLVSTWADKAKEHYPNNIITIQKKEKGTWQDWCLV